MRAMLRELLKRDIVFFDGGMGTMLQKNGLKRGDRPELMNINAPDTVERIQKMYADAGSNIICTNTFGASKINMDAIGLDDEEVISKAVAIAKKAGGGRTLTALDIGPIGLLLEPFGDMTFDGAYELYARHAILGERAGADLAVIETMSDLREIKAAILAVKENTKLPIIAMMTFTSSGRTFTGCIPESFAVTAEKLGVSAVGINCSLAPNEIFGTAKRIAQSTSLALSIKPNAGLPQGEEGRYDVTPEMFASQMEQYASIGVKIVGGCCGTTPDYIKELVKTYADIKPERVAAESSTRLCVPGAVDFADELAYDNREEDRGRDADAVIKGAAESEGDGRVVDIRLPHGCTPQDAVSIVNEIQSCTDRQIHIVSDDIDALSAVMRVFPGVPAVTGIGCDPDAMRAAADRYGAVIVL